MIKTSGVAKKRLILFGIVFALAILFLASLLFFRQDTLTRQLNVWQIKMELRGFKLVNISKDTTKTLTKEELEAKREDTALRISKIKVSDRKKFIEDRKFLLASLFEPTTSPYPEVITNVVSCPSEFKPKSREVEKGIIYTLFAGERFNYGICSQDLVVYQSLYGIFDCKEKGVFEIRVFSTDSKTIEPVIGSFQC